MLLQAARLGYVCVMLGIQQQGPNMPAAHLTTADTDAEGMGLWYRGCLLNASTRICPARQLARPAAPAAAPAAGLLLAFAVRRMHAVLQGPAMPPCRLQQPRMLQ